MPNLGFPVDLNGFTVLQVGDTETTAADIEPLGWADRSMDLALLPYWKFRGKAGAFYRKAVGANRVRAFHLPGPTAPTSWCGADGDINGLVEALDRITGVKALARIGSVERF